jgi:hypothetical protein
MRQGELFVATTSLTPVSMTTTMRKRTQRLTTVAVLCALIPAACALGCSSGGLDKEILATDGGADGSAEADDSAATDAATSVSDAPTSSDTAVDTSVADVAPDVPISTTCPRVTPPPPASCAAIAGAHYDRVGTTSASPIDPATSPDVNLLYRNWRPAAGAVRARTPISHPEDPKGSPQLNTLFGDSHVPTFTAVYQVQYWDWGSHSCNGYIFPGAPGPANGPEVTLLGLAATPGDLLHVPHSGYQIDPPDFAAMVIYATSNTITLKYTLADDIGVANGYAVQLTGVCVDPGLVAAYQAAVKDTSRHQLPGLHAGQAWGYAASSEIQVAIRDTGSWLDPRWCPDWWTCP